MLAYGGISEARKSKMVENFGDSSENHTENSLSIGAKPSDNITIQCLNVFSQD